MLDAGITLEAPTQSLIDRLASQRPDQWDPAAVAPLKQNTQARPDGLPQKVAYGSNFPYRQTDDFFPVHRDKVHLLSSFARGGLSTVWGAAVLPHRQEEISDWPVSLKDLEPHYRAVLKWIPFSAVRDDLEAFFPLYAERPGELRFSRQSERLQDRLSQNREALRKEGIHFGRSRLSLRAGDAGDAKGCVYCGLCMYGCPYQSIYCSDQTLKELLKNPRFRYEKDVVIRRVEETAAGVTLHAEDRNTCAARRFSGNRVFLAAGILPTTQILLESLGAYNHPLDMTYSQHFMVPLLAQKGETNLSREKLHTLAQMFLEVFDPEISPEAIHLQAYTYNDLFRQGMLNSAAGPAFRLIPPLSDWILSKVLIIQGYLHSKYSTPIRLELVKQPADSKPHLELKGRISPAVRQKTRQLIKKLSRTRALHGTFPLSPWLKVSPPGQGFHNAGTFPMRAEPGPFESDRWGRPHGFQRVHAVDATVHPSAPATTITLTVMANAHRIGSGAELV
jgi:choline dehydrogenase-like flavoprotein